MMITLFFLIIFHSHRCFQTNIYFLQNFSDILLILLPLEFYRNFTTTTMETAEYWLMACKYVIWNATITLLQFWGRGPQSDYPWHCLRMHLHHLLLDTYQSHTTCQLSEDILFGCFVIALSAAFTQQLSPADEGYESGSDTVDLPTPLRKTPCIHHVFSMEHASFNPAHTTPCSTVTITPRSSPQTPTRPVCCTAYHSTLIVTRIQTALQYTPTVHMMTRIHTALQYTQTAQMRKKIFQQYH